MTKTGAIPVSLEIVAVSPFIWLVAGYRSITPNTCSQCHQRQTRPLRCTNAIAQRGTEALTAMFWEVGWVITMAFATQAALNRRYSQVCGDGPH